jgi:hypothetical protein
VLFFAACVRETKIDEFDLILFDKVEYLFGLHESFLQNSTHKKCPAYPGQLNGYKCMKRAKMVRHVSCCFYWQAYPHGPLYRTSIVQLCLSVHCFSAAFPANPVPRVCAPQAPELLYTARL